jgi:hypothetical protein
MIILNLAVRVTTGTRVTKMSEPELNDPVFYDDSEWIMCSQCDNEFDFNTYNSKTCESCENGETE